MDVIFSGQVAPNPSELLGKERFASMIDRAKNEYGYDYIIIDCPPLGSVIDAAVVARVCDGTIIVIESDNLSYRITQKVKEQLDKSGCRILGAVLNKVEMEGKGYYGKYYGSFHASVHFDAVYDYDVPAGIQVVPA